MSETFERPAPDLVKITSAWDRWERGDDTAGRVMADMKTAGLADVLRRLVDTGWQYDA